jgi:hypothetical protein
VGVFIETWGGWITILIGVHMELEDGFVAFQGVGSWNTAFALANFP